MSRQGLNVRGEKRAGRFEGMTPVESTKSVVERRLPIQIQVVVFGEIFRPSDCDFAQAL